MLPAGLAAASVACVAAETGHDHGKADAPSGELVFFLSAEGRNPVLQNRTGPAQNEDPAVAADIVLAVQRDRFRVFGEYLLSSRDHDLERLQFGFEPVADTVVWLGRYHQPASAWNTEHHHGRYLQTSITRPSIELWEDEGGVLPQHLTGLLVDSRRPIADNAGVHVAIGGGLGTTVNDEGLEPFNLLKPRREGRQMSWAGRLAYLPDYVGASSFGVLFGYHRMPVTEDATAAALSASRVRHGILGAYADWRQDPWRILATGYSSTIHLDGTAGTRTERFSAGYLQVEHTLPKAWTVYGRAEVSHGAQDSLYIASAHPDFMRQRALAGLRWDFLPRQALTLELGRGDTLHERRNEVRFQWSAALP